MNLQETIYSAQHKIGVEEVGPGVRETTLIGLMLECNVFTEWMKTHIVDNITDLSIVWHYDRETHDLDVDYIYDHNSGEVYWENNKEIWTEHDEKLLSSILMWAELENTII